MTVSMAELKNNLNLKLLIKFKNLTRKALKKQKDYSYGYDPKIISEGLNNDTMNIKLFYEYQKAISLYSGNLFKAIKSKRLEDIDTGAGVILQHSNTLIPLFKKSGIPDSELKKLSSTLAVEDLEKANFVLSLMVQEKGFDDKMGLFNKEQGFGGLSTRKRPIAQSKQKLYRGLSRLSAEQFLNILKTKRFKLGALESWTHNKRSAMGYANAGNKLGSNYSILFSVFNPQQYGSSIEDQSQYSGELEVMLGGGIIKVDPYNSNNISSELDMFSEDISRYQEAKRRNLVPKLDTIADVERYVKDLEKKKKDIRSGKLQPGEEINLPDRVAYHITGAFVSDYADAEYRNRMLREQRFKINKKLIRKLIKESIRKHIL